MPVGNPPEVGLDLVFLGSKNFGRTRPKNCKSLTGPVLGRPGPYFVSYRFDAAAPCNASPFQDDDKRQIVSLNQLRSNKLSVIRLNLYRFQIQ